MDRPECGLNENGIPNHRSQELIRKSYLPEDLYSCNHALSGCPLAFQIEGTKETYCTYGFGNVEQKLKKHFDKILANF